MGERNSILPLLFSGGLIGAAIAGVVISYELIQSYSSRQNEQLSEKQKLLKRLNRPDLEKEEFSQYELSIAQDIITSEDIEISFADIGGLKLEKEDIYDNLILPMKYWKEYSQNSEGKKLISCPPGMLLHGKPGTGKTMLAKAIAKEANVSFLHVKPSSILDKYVGESEKLITSVFSFARKIAPCVIFIDEMDTLLRQRNGSNTMNPLSSALGVFLSEWDGLSTNTQSPVLVLGATNRPADIDPAFLRRMPLMIKVSDPDALAREEILRCLLRKEGSLSDNINLATIAGLLEGFNGSDLKEVCRLAGVSRMKRMINERNQVQVQGATNSPEIDHLLRNEDFDTAVSRMLSIRENHNAEKRHNFLEALYPGIDSRS